MEIKESREIKEDIEKSCEKETFFEGKVEGESSSKKKSIKRAKIYLEQAISLHHFHRRKLSDIIIIGRRPDGILTAKPH